MLLALALSFCAHPAPPNAVSSLRDDPERREPSAKAPAHKVLAWTSKGGLRYTWVLPKGYEPESPRNLSVILHGTGLDYRWGHWNNKPGVFRPEDVVVSVDGPTPDGEARLFLGKPEDAKAFREFLGEMRETFAVDRVFLYGHSQGGFFVVYFAGEYPDEVAGVVAHASGAWNWSKTGKSVRKVAIAFMHGTSDPVVPYRQSPGSRDHYAKQGFELLHLRRLPQYNHWPNAVRATETLGWAQGMTAKDPREALAVAKEILRPKGSDEYQWQTLVGFAGARDVLRRLEGKGPAPFAEVPPEVEKDARELMGAIEDEGAKHVSALRKAMGKPKKLELDGKAWLGHLVSLREDFRGVDSVEAFVEEIGYDKLSAAHAKTAGKILDAWYGGGPPKGIYEEVAGGIGESFLFEGFPPELAEKMEEWHGDAKKLGVSPRAQKQYAQFEAWRKGWKEGLDAYQDVWKRWKLP
ncbi:MAG TPA: alpha/beta fold hydrolase [Planctomycetota bacterium]|nr:alpha/beta fold hydrolase [Planctomycetota bacterium]